jgi:phosphoribosylformimino-5-aminoimidazole carboxamide ribotide isomerase
MQIIPVIDLKEGQVVHAVRGDRQHYQPIHVNSVLTTASDIDSVVSGFLNLYPFRTFYIADLDAICATGQHASLIAGLLAAYPHIDFWIDNGSRLADLETPQPPNYTAIIGTESQLQPAFSRQRFILSLDYKQEYAAGHPDWFTSSCYWPQQIIVMTLSRVGSHSGPDFAKLKTLAVRHADKQFVAAGGIRHADDLRQLADMGVEAALVATALHRGLIAAADLRAQAIYRQAKKYPGKPGYF